MPPEWSKEFDFYQSAGRETFPTTLLAHTCRVLLNRFFRLSLTLKLILSEPEFTEFKNEQNSGNSVTA